METETDDPLMLDLSREDPRLVEARAVLTRTRRPAPGLSAAQLAGLRRDEAYAHGREVLAGRRAARWFYALHAPLRRT